MNPEPSTFPCSVILAAHGSLATVEANSSLFRLAEQVAQAGIFSVVTPAFLNGHPDLSNVFADLPAGDVIIVPVMTSAGYYLQNVIPQRLAQNPQLHRYRVFMADPIGLHPELPQVVAERITDMLKLLSLEPSETTFLVIGHGSRKNTDSRNSTDQLAAGLQTYFVEQKVIVGFIDQDPTIEHSLAQITTRNIYAIPFLIALGPHTTEDVPRALGLDTRGEIEFPFIDVTSKRSLVCDLPIGLYPEMAMACIDLAASQLLEGKPVSIADWEKRKPA